MRQGRDQAVLQALLRVRRLLRSEQAAVVSLSETLEDQEGSFSGLTAVQLLQQEQLLPGEMAGSRGRHEGTAMAAEVFMALSAAGTMAAAYGTLTRLLKKSCIASTVLGQLQPLTSLLLHALSCRSHS